MPALLERPPAGQKAPPEPVAPFEPGPFAPAPAEDARSYRTRLRWLGRLGARRRLIVRVLLAVAGSAGLVIVVAHATPGHRSGPSTAAGADDRAAPPEHGPDPAPIRACAACPPPPPPPQQPPAP